MPVSICINREQKLLLVKAVGEITSGDIQLYYTTLSGMPHVGTCNKAIVDFTAKDGCFGKGAMQALKQMGAQFHHRPALPKGAKMAVVVCSSLAFGFVRLFMASRGDHIWILPFKDMEKAVVWLGVTQGDITWSEGEGKLL